METFVITVVWAAIIFFVGKWVIKTYVTEPEKDKRKGLYKFEEFKTALNGYNISTTPIKSNEFQLTFRENITNGVEKIGHLDYSVNDFMQTNGYDKKHNYYFTVETKVKELSLTEKSNYFNDFSVEICRTQIATLRNKIVNNQNYQRAIKLNQLR